MIKLTYHPSECWWRRTLHSSTFYIHVCDLIVSIFIKVNTTTLMEGILVKHLGDKNVELT